MASFNSGVNLPPNCLNKAIDSRCVNTVPPFSEYSSVRHGVVPAIYDGISLAFLFTPAILPRKVLNSSRVMSVVRHSASAGSAPFAGVNGLVHRSCKLVSNILVVACKSFCP